MTDHNDEDQALDQWSRRLTHALQILDFEMDQKLILRLAEESARSVNGSAAPISALIVGYAAGLAARDGKAGSRDAIQSAAEVALRLCEHGADGGTDSKGWATTGQ